MDWNSSLLAPYRMRTVRVGIHVTGLTVALLVVYRCLPHHGPMHEDAFSVLLGAALAGAAIVALLPWQRLFERGLGIWLFYAWSCFDIVLITLAILATGGSASELFILYSLTSVFFAASYPPRSQAVLFGTTIFAYVASLFIAGMEISASTLMVRVAAVALVTYLTAFLSRELMRRMVGEAQQSKRNAALTEEVARREARFRCLVQNAADAICVVRPGGELQFATPALERLLGYRPEAFLGMSVFAAVHPDDLPAVRRTFDQLLEVELEPVELQVRLRQANGNWRWAQAVITNLLSEPAVDGIVINFRDVTERRAFEEQLRYQAFHDPLTGLPNRAQFTHKVTTALSRLEREGTQLGVVLLDLDGFKSVNDSLGHELGDDLLIAVADRLRECLRPGDLLARLGGDEFTLLLDPVGGPAEALQLAHSVAAALARPVSFGTHRSTQTASIGVALSTEKTASANDLLRRADLAMYAAKDRGKAQCALFDYAMSSRAEERLQMEEELRGAVERKNSSWITSHCSASGASTVWCRSAGSLAAPSARSNPAVGIYSRRRGNGSDLRHRQLGPARVLHTSSPVDAGDRPGE